MTVKLSTLENIKFLVDDVVATQKLIELVTEYIKRGQYIAAVNPLKVASYADKKLMTEISAFLGLPLSADITLLEMSAILPIRKDTLIEKRRNAINKLRVYGIKIDLDGPLNTTLKDAGDREGTTASADSEEG